MVKQETDLVCLLSYFDTGGLSLQFVEGDNHNRFFGYFDDLLGDNYDSNVFLIYLKADLNVALALLSGLHPDFTISS